MHYGNTVVDGCHSECLDFAQHTFPQIQVLSSWLRFAGKYSFEPLARHDDIRRETIKGTLLGIVGTQVRQRRLPLELVELIVDHLVRPYAVASLCEHWLAADTSSGSFDCAVPTTSPIWARYAKFEGVYYLADLCPRPEHGYVKIWGRNHQPGAVYVARDHVGVRRVLFSRPDNIDAQPGVWWHILRNEKDLARLRGTSDVSSTDQIPSERSMPLISRPLENQTPLCWPCQQEKQSGEPTPSLAYTFIGLTIQREGLLSRPISRKSLGPFCLRWLLDGPLAAQYCRCYGLLRVPIWRTYTAPPRPHQRV